MKKKSNALLFAGIGCGVFALGGLAIGAFIFMQARTAYNEAAAGVASALAAASAVPLPTSTDAPGAAPGATTPEGSGTGAAGNPCEQAAACCRVVVQKTTAGSLQSSALKGCDNFLNPHFPAASCAQALNGYRMSAKQLGVTCN